MEGAQAATATTATKTRPLAYRFQHLVRPRRFGESRSVRTRGLGVALRPFFGSARIRVHGVDRALATCSTNAKDGSTSASRTPVKANIPVNQRPAIVSG